MEQNGTQRAISVVASLDTADCDAAGDAATMAGSLAAPELFAVIFDRHFDTVYRYVARRIGAGPGAEDVTAETFTVAFSRRGVFDPALGRCSSWLLGIATNLLRRYYRSETRRLVAMARLGTKVIKAARDQDGHDRWGDAGGLDAALGAGLAALPAAQRDVISLVDGAGLSYHEAAVALGVPLGTVQSHPRLPDRLCRRQRQLPDAARLSDHRHVVGSVVSTFSPP